MALGNTPNRLTNIFLERNKSFALNIRFKLTTGEPYDLTNHMVRLVADEPKHWGGEQVLLLQADHLSETEGLAQFKFQATDTDLEYGEYSYDVTLRSPREYTTPILKGTIVIGDNTDPMNDNVFYDVHPSDELVVLFGTSGDVEICLSMVDGLVGPPGEQGRDGAPTAVFIQPTQPVPEETPPYFPLWVDTDAEYHHSGYVYEAPVPDPNMPTGVLYFDNDETVIPPDGVGVLYVKDQNGALIPVTRYGPPGPHGPPGVVIIDPEPPSTTGLAEGSMWVDEDSNVVGGGGGGGGTGDIEGNLILDDSDVIFVRNNLEARIGQGYSAPGPTLLGRVGSSGGGFDSPVNVFEARRDGFSIPPASQDGDAITKAQLDSFIASVQGLRGIRYWHGTGGVGTWDSRPAIPAGIHCECFSVLDAMAPPPPGSVAGDLWKRAPGAVL